MNKNKIDLDLIEKFEKAKVKMSLIGPLFSNLVLGKKMVESSHIISDISIDGEHVYYNSEFVRNHDVNNLIFLIANQSLSFSISNFIFKHKNNETNESIYKQSIDIKVNTLLMKYFKPNLFLNIVPDGLYMNIDYLNLGFNDVYGKLEKIALEENQKNPNNSIEDSLKIVFPNGTATKTINAKNEFFNESLIKTTYKNDKDYYYLDDSATIEDISTSFFINKTLKELIDSFKIYEKDVSNMEIAEKSIFSYIKKIETLAYEENDKTPQHEYNVFESNNQKTKISLSLKEQSEIGRQSVEILKNEYLDLSERFIEIGEASIFSAKENIKNMDEKLEEDRISFYERYENFINFARLNFDNDLFVKYVVLILIRTYHAQPNQNYFKDKKSLAFILKSIVY